ncbi:MMPL family transporter [Hamadaea tsunoensis]|uniref:MMPL family transporter n=1 Tax=Hamadaea tsunoensis TaxID=53368 RepID=UPI0004054039|nr:MMPL family transporter [Hamadaea tsunoensis]
MTDHRIQGSARPVPAARAPLRGIELRETTARTSVWRWLLPALTLVAWLVVGAALGPLSGRTSEVQKNDNSAFLPTGVESAEVNELDRKFVSAESTPAIMVYSRPGGLTAADRTQIAADRAKITAHFGDQLAAPPAGPIPSTKDDTAAQLIVPFTSSDGDTLSANVGWLRDLPHEPGLQVNVAGPGGLLADLVNSFAGIDGVLVLVTGAVVLLILVVVYRSPLLPLIVLFSAVFALSAANGVVYLLAKNDVITLNGQSQGILDVLVLGAATDYALLLVARYREELRLHRSRFDAIRKAYRAVVEPIVASGGTVIIALLCLLISDLRSNKGLGPVGAIGIACAMIASLSLLPAILALVGRVAFWPFRPHFDSHPTEQHGVWAKVAAYVGRHARLVWILTSVVLIALTFGLFRLQANGIPQSDAFTGTPDSKAGQQVLAEHFDSAGGSAEIIMSAAQLEAVLAAVKQVPGAVDAVPYTGQPVVPGQPAVPPKVVDGLARVDVALSAPPDSEASYQTIRDLRAAVHAVPGAQAKVGGFVAINLDVQDTARRDRTVIIPPVLVVVFVILMLLLRSVVAPLLLVATVVLSFLATLGVCGVVFRDVIGFAGEDSSFPLFAFIFLVALGVDYNIFLMTRVREEVARRGHRSGVLTALAVTGGVITSAGLVLAATFSSLAVLPLVFLAEIAFAVAFGVLLDTLVVRSLLVPALALDIGPRIWWPSRLGRDRTGVEAGTETGIETGDETDRETG